MGPAMNATLSRSSIKANAMTMPQQTAQKNQRRPPKNLSAVGVAIFYS